MFLQRVESAWNILPEMVVEADILVAFKRASDRHMDVKEIDGYCR